MDMRYRMPMPETERRRLEHERDALLARLPTLPNLRRGSLSDRGRKCRLSFPIAHRRPGPPRRVSVPEGLTGLRGQYTGQPVSAQPKWEIRKNC